jgi:hypothetical protein
MVYEIFQSLFGPGWRSLFRVQWLSRDFRVSISYETFQSLFVHETFQGLFGHETFQSSMVLEAIGASDDWGFPVISGVIFESGNGRQFNFEGWFSELSPSSANEYQLVPETSPSANEA